MLYITHYMAGSVMSYLQPEIQGQCTCTKMADYHILFCQSAATEHAVHEKNQFQTLSIKFVMCTEKPGWLTAIQETMHMWSHNAEIYLWIIMGILWKSNRT